MTPTLSPATPMPRPRRRNALALAAGVALLAALVTGAHAALATTGGWGTGRDGVAPFGDAGLGTGPAAGSGAVVALAPSRTGGYWVARADGTVTPEGAAHDYGSAAPVRTPVAGMAAAPDGRGYWLATADGGVLAFGGAPFEGSAARLGLSAPIVGIAAAPSGHGYWLVGADGGVFAFGDARYVGSAAGRVRAAPIVGMSATPSGRGYWLVGADGGVLTFGDAPFLGSQAGRPLSARVTGMAATPSGHGYWLVGADGGVFTFGDAAYRGSVRTDAGLAPAVAIAGTADGAGYWVALGPLDRRPLGQFVATCYTGGVSTATGAVPSSNVIAVDPGVIPLGSRVFIPGIGVRVAADTGGGIRGARVDVWEPSLQQCVQFGVQPVVVYLIG